MKRRGRKAAPSKPKQKGRGGHAERTPRSGTTPKKTRAPRRPVDPDNDVFIPRSGVAAHTKTLNDDDEPVFIPKPRLQQSDWVHDVGAPDAPPRDPSVWEPFAGIKPRAGSPVGWSRAELYAHGLEYVPADWRRGERVRCRYGCTGTTSNVQGVSHHSYNCAYWTREGLKHSPF